MSTPPPPAASSGDVAITLAAVGAEHLSLQPCEPREPGRGEVRVRMLAAAINPSDRMFVAGTYGTKPQPPCVPGFEGVGIVEACGGGLVARAMKDRRVAVAVEQGGTWQSVVTTSAKTVIPVGSAMPIEHAATFFVNPTTAWVMTREVLAVPPGKWLVQTAAASSLARMIARLGRREGFKTCGIVRRESQRDALLAEGADAVVVFDAATQPAEELVEAVRTACGEVRHAIDPVGGPLGSAVLDCLGENGRMLVYGSLAEEPIAVASRPTIFHRRRIEGFALGAWLQQRSLLAKGRLFLKIRRLVEDGTLATGAVRSFAPEAFADALDPASTASGEKGVFRFDGGEPG